MQRNQTRWPSKTSYTIQELPRFNSCLSLLLLCGYLSFSSIKDWTCFWKRPDKFISEFFSSIMKNSKKKIIPISLKEQHFKFLLNKYMCVYLSTYLSLSHTHLYSSSCLLLTAIIVWTSTKKRPWNSRIVNTVGRCLPKGFHSYWNKTSQTTSNAAGPWSFSRITMDY